MNNVGRKMLPTTLLVKSIVKFKISAKYEISVKVKAQKSEIVSRNIIIKSIIFNFYIIIFEMNN